MKYEIEKISKEELENNLFIIKIGTNERPATDEDMDEFCDTINEVVAGLDLDKEPSILITHHCVSVESMDKETLKNLINRE